LSKIILHLCADIGSDSYYYQKNGYDVRLIGVDIGVENYNPPSNVYGIIANPVCTEFSTAKGFHKIGDYHKGMFLVDHCKRIIKESNPKFWVIENPANGKLKDFIGIPDMVYQPWEFGDPWTKKTALWGNFNKPCALYQSWEDVPKNDKLYIKPRRRKPSLACLHKSSQKHIENFKKFKVNDDMSFRSLCPQGFAKAFYEANK